MFNSIVNVLFGCSHKRTTFPQTRRPGALAFPMHVQGTYVVCLECGSEFRYDWNAMDIREQIDSRPHTEFSFRVNQAQTVGESS